MKTFLSLPAAAAMAILSAALAAGGCIPAAAQDLTRFRTPSNRIHCMFVTAQGKTEPTGLACDIDQSFIKKPIRPKPRDCQYDWGQRFELGNDSDAGLECASDWVGSDDSEIIAYGRTIKRGRIACHSETTGLTCRNEKGRGFFLSRDRQTIF